jgi:hypothetical protein
MHGPRRGQREKKRFCIMEWESIKHLLNDTVSLLLWTGTSSFVLSFDIGSADEWTVLTFRDPLPIYRKTSGNTLAKGRQGWIIELKGTKGEMPMRKERRSTLLQLDHFFRAGIENPWPVSRIAVDNIYVACELFMVLYKMSHVPYTHAHTSRVPAVSLREHLTNV